MKRNWILLLFMGGAAIASGGSPNVILLMADDLGWGDTGYNGNKVIQTPHLDQMAGEGIRFDRFYSASAVCSPTRASCLTGRNPFRTGIFNANNGILRPEEVTLAELLKGQGYATGFFGKWHLGTFTAEVKDANRGGPKHPELLNLPTAHGFDTYFATESKVPTCDPMKKPKKVRGMFWDPLDSDEPFDEYGTFYWSNESGKNNKVSENLAGDDSRVIMDRAIPFLETAAAAEKPFMAVIWFHAPHLPCVATPEWREVYQEHDLAVRNYAGCVSALDQQVGRLRAKLEELGIADNTMIWFCSDNGPENNTPGSTGGFARRKRSLHDGGVRVPGLLVWPGKIKTGRVESIPCVTSDYLPTVMAAVGIPEENAPYELDGENLMPLVEGKSFKRSRPICFQYAGQANCSTRQFKFYEKGGHTELYDMPADPKEQNNIAGKRPEKVAEMRKQWLAWQAATKTSFEGKEYGTVSLERVRQKWVDVIAPKPRRKNEK